MGERVGEAIRRRAEVLRGEAGAALVEYGLLVAGAIVIVGAAVTYLFGALDGWLRWLGDTVSSFGR